jgi:hypothetical protein
MVTAVDLGFRVTDFKSVKPGDIFIEYAGGEGLLVAMRIKGPDNQPWMLTFHPHKPTVSKSKRHEDRDVGVIDSRIVSPAINSKNLLQREEGLGAGSMLFGTGETLLRADFNGTEVWEVNLASGDARISKPFAGPFWTDRWSIHAVRSSGSDEIFRFDGSALSP